MIHPKILSKNQNFIHYLQSIHNKLDVIIQRKLRVILQLLNENHLELLSKYRNIDLEFI